MKKTYTAILFALTALLVGCATNSDTLLQETHVVVTPSTSEDIYLVVSKPLSDTDDVYDPTQGVSLPMGKYEMESEDINYWYFRAPRPVVLALYEFGRQTTGMRLYGGIALSKAGDNTLPGPCIYTDDAGKNGKILIWTTSPEFLKSRGEKWRLSTDAATPAPAVAPDTTTK